jgi:hypothetical protein
VRWGQPTNQIAPSRISTGNVFVGFTVPASGLNAQCSSWLPVRPAPPPPVCGRCLPRFWADQAHADQPSVVIDARDDIFVQLQFGDHGRREVNTSGVQLGKSDRLVAGLVRELQQRV